MPEVFTAEQVSEIVRKRLAKSRTIPSDVLRDMLVSLADRVDSLEAYGARLEARIGELEDVQR